MLAEAFVGEETTARIRTSLAAIDETSESVFTEARLVTDEELELVREQRERARLAANAWPSEGSVADPVLLQPGGEPHLGSIGPGGVSYYRIDVDRRSDVYVEMSDTDGFAGMEYYGGDSGYGSWASASSGGDPSEQITPAQPGSYYVAVLDLDEDPLVGVSFTIAVRQDFVLLPGSVGSLGELESQARSVQLARAPQGRVELSGRLRPNGVSVFRVRNPRAGTLRIIMTPSTETLGMRWWGETAGSSTGTRRQVGGGETLIEIFGLSGDAEGYFYVAGDPLLHADDEFRLVVEIVPE